MKTYKTKILDFFQIVSLKTISVIDFKLICTPDLTSEFTLDNNCVWIWTQKYFETGIYYFNSPVILLI